MAKKRNDKGQFLPTDVESTEPAGEPRDLRDDDGTERADELLEERQRRRAQRDEREAFEVGMRARIMRGLEQYEEVARRYFEKLESPKATVTGEDPKGRPVIIVIESVETVTIEGQILRVGLESGRDVFVSAKSIGMDETPSIDEASATFFGAPQPFTLNLG